MTRRRVALAQGVYYVASGLWPIVSLQTFERVTGPKVDGWLVRMVGLLAATIGGVLGGRALAGDPARPPDAALAIGSAASFAAIDVVYAGRGRISKIYLADAAVELALVAAWLVSRRSSKTPRA